MYLLHFDLKAVSAGSGPSVGYRVGRGGIGVGADELHAVLRDDGQRLADALLTVQLADEDMVDVL